MCTGGRERIKWIRPLLHFALLIDSLVVPRSCFILEMEAEEKRGAVIAAEDVEAAWIVVLAALRTRLLALPDRLAPAVHAEASPAGVRDVIRAAIREALEELAESDVRPEREDNEDIGADPAGDGGAAPDGARGAEGADPAAGDDDQ